MIIEKTKKDLNPKRIVVGAEYTSKQSKEAFKEYENIKRFYPELGCWMDEGKLILKTIHGQNGYTSNNEKDIVKWLLELHNRGVNHGDFSPSNIITDETGKVWVIDWSEADRGLQFVDVVSYVLMKHWGKIKAKDFEKVFLNDSFFRAYLIFCINIYAKKVIARLNRDYSVKQKEESFFRELLK